MCVAVHASLALLSWHGKERGAGVKVHWFQLIQPLTSFSLGGGGEGGDVCVIANHLVSIGEAAAWNAGQVYFEMYA